MGRTKRNDHRGNRRGGKKRSHSDCWYIPNIANDSDFYEHETFELQEAGEDGMTDDSEREGPDSETFVEEVDEYGDGGYRSFDDFSAYSSRRQAS